MINLKATKKQTKHILKKCDFTKMAKKRSNIESIDDEIEYLSSVKTQQHLSFAQARGIIQLFNYYFREKDSNGRTKRLPRTEKDRRWKLYKAKVYQDYNRLVRGNFNSEAALVKRYSDPMAFLKYKLKRNKNLKVSDLSSQDQEYYHELGGVDDIEEMFRRQANIDSISRAVKRRKLGNGVVNNNNNIGSSIDMDHATNHNIPNSRLISTTDSLQPSSFSLMSNGLSIPPPLSQQASIPPKTEETTLHSALNQLNQNLNDFEQEQLQKKKTLATEITKEKTKTFINIVQNEFTEKPELLGIFPNSSLEDHLTAGFDLWLSNNKEKIRELVPDQNMLVEQLSILRSDHPDWIAFLHKWKLRRIIQDDVFNMVWTWVADELNIKTNDKEEEEA